jgi:hypothetical protein
VPDRRDLAGCPAIPGVFIRIDEAFERNGTGGVNIRLRVAPRIEKRHPPKRCLLALLECAKVLVLRFTLALIERIGLRGIGDKADQDRALRRRQLGGSFVEIVSGRCRDAAAAVAVVDGIQIKLENAVLGKVVLQLDGVSGFLKIAQNTVNF